MSLAGRIHAQAGYLDTFLANFRLYRKMVSADWYCVSYERMPELWTTHRPMHSPPAGACYEILSEEHY